MMTIVKSRLFPGVLAALLGSCEGTAQAHDATTLRSLGQELGALRQRTQVLEQKLAELGASYLADSLAARLWTGWGIAVAGGILGAGASYRFDLPTGAAIVCVLAVLLLVAAGAGGPRRRQARDRVPAPAAGCPGKGRHRSVASSGGQYWLHITGLPGWKRRQIGLPAFRQARCTPPPPRPNVWQRLRTALKMISRPVSALLHRTPHHARQRPEAASYGPRKASP